MPKNLILIHLESISNTILWQYRVELKTIWKMMKNSFAFNKFYTASTATEQSTRDLLYGTSAGFDWCTVFGQTRDTTHPGYRDIVWKSLFHQLSNAGYGRDKRHYLVYELFDCKKMSTDYPGIYGPTQEELLLATRVALAEIKRDSIPFYFHFLMSDTHITFSDKVKDSANGFSDRFRLAYTRLDNAISKFLGILAEFDLIKDSILVFYGDHGDELWSHGLNKGWCHVITPYASQCWTPLFIYEQGQPPGSTDRLASMIDLKTTLINRLIPDYEPEHYPLNEEWINHLGNRNPYNIQPFVPRSGCFPRSKDIPFGGIDLAKETREYAFSQNLFSLQQEYNDSAKALVKGYAITDGTYRLTVTSGGDTVKNGGMEFFCDIIDPTNSRNLLDFFILNGDGDIQRFAPPAQVISTEFLLTFNEEAVEHLRFVFQKLKSVLREHVKDKEKNAMVHNDGKGATMPDYAFKYSRKRSYRYC